MEIFIVQAQWLRAIDFTSSNTGHKRMGLMKTRYFSMKVVSNSRTWEYSKLHAESLALKAEPGHYCQVGQPHTQPHSQVTHS